MPYQLQPRESIGEGLRRIYCEQIDAALREVDAAPGDPDRAVHEVRKRIKKLRALLRLGRGLLPEDFKPLNRALRDTGRELSTLRDAHVRLETLDALGERYGGHLEKASLDAVRESLRQARYSKVPEKAAIIDPLNEAADTLGALRKRADQWVIDDPSPRNLLWGAKRIYRQGRNLQQACTAADVGDGTYHQWRKRSKDLFHLVALLRNCWKRPQKAFQTEARALSRQLGLEHDLTVLRQDLLSDLGKTLDPARLEPAIGALRAWQTELRTRVQPLGMRLYAEKPSAFGRRLQYYWIAWKEEEHLQPGRQALERLSEA